MNSMDVGPALFATGVDNELVRRACSGFAVLGSTAFFSQFHAKYHAKALGGNEQPETGSTRFCL
jgi:hypothetical protein